MGAYDLGYIQISTALSTSGDQRFKGPNRGLTSLVQWGRGGYRYRSTTGLDKSAPISFQTPSIQGLEKILRNVC